MINFLSVDWDYFFPDFNKFDWSASEDSPIFYELIWQIRYSTSPINKATLARDYYNPHWIYKHFWDILLINSKPEIVVIEDSHSEIKQILENIKKVRMFNFDQHTDDSKKIDCGVNCENWVTYYKDKFEIYKYYKPKWVINGLINPKILTQMQKNYPDFKFIFVCRSSPWTSSWNDDKWLEFIQILKQKLSNDCCIREDKRVLQKREFDLNFANELLMDQEKYFSSLERGRSLRSQLL